MRAISPVPVSSECSSIKKMVNQACTLTFTKSESTCFEHVPRSENSVTRPGREEEEEEEGGDKARALGGCPGKEGGITA